MVKLKKKVTLRQKVQEEPETHPGYTPSGNRKVLLGLLALLVIGILCWAVFSRSGDTEKASEAQPAIAQAAADSVAASDSSAVGTPSDSTAAPAEDAESKVAEADDAAAAKPSQSAMQEDAVAEETPVNQEGDIQQKANDVIRGVYGNGQVRKNKLGHEYRAIQDKVNEMYRKGLVH